MKVWVYDDGNAGTGIYLFKQRIHDDLGYNFLGTLDLDIQKEKKWVTKTVAAKTNPYNGMNWEKNWLMIDAIIPVGARNVLLTYEVEE